MVPVIGTAIVIWSGNGGWAKAFLSQPTLVYVGKISYSLYLWHWPVIVLSRHLGYEVHASVLMAIMTALAVMSYRLVEQPFRRRADVIRAIGYGCAGALGIAATLALMAMPAYDTSEFDRPQTYGRFFDIDPRSAEDEQRRAFYAGADAPEPSAPPDAHRRDGIVVGSGTGSPAVVVLGDSHGCMWAHAIRTAVDEAGLKAEAYEAGRVLVRSTAAKFPNCEIVPTKDLFTADDRVWFLDGRTLLYLDDDHHATAGAVQVLPRLRKILAPPLTSRIEPRSRGARRGCGTGWKRRRQSSAGEQGGGRRVEGWHLGSCCCRSRARTSTPFTPERKRTYSYRCLHSLPMSARSADDSSVQMGA